MLKGRDQPSLKLGKTHNFLMVQLFYSLHHSIVCTGRKFWITSLCSNPFTSNKCVQIGENFSFEKVTTPLICIVNGPFIFVYVRKYSYYSIGTDKFCSVFPA